MLWTDVKNTETITLGCGIDTISNAMVFTRSGKRLGRPFYLKGDAPLLKKQPPQPSIHVVPKCAIGKDLKLPSITFAINYGANQFQWTSDLNELFDIMHHEITTWQPPNISKEHKLLIIDC